MAEGIGSSHARDRAERQLIRAEASLTPLTVELEQEQTNTSSLSRYLLGIEQQLNALLVGTESYRGQLATKMAEIEQRQSHEDAKSAASRRQLESHYAVDSAALAAPATPSSHGGTVLYRGYDVRIGRALPPSPVVFVAPTLVAEVDLPPGVSIAWIRSCRLRASTVPMPVVCNQCSSGRAITMALAAVAARASAFSSCCQRVGA